MLSRPFSVACSVTCSLAIAACGLADFPTPTNNEPDSDHPVMTAQQAAAAMKLPDGFSISVFADEPDVQNPIDLAWDASGNLWIAENYTYSDRTEHFDLSLRDRVLIFSDTDQDGVADQRRVFTDDVQMLTSVEVGLGGVWLMCPPKLLFIPDADHDGIPDGPAEVVLDGFEVASQNYHNFANGLRFGPDGWLYGRCGGSCPGRIGIPGTRENERVALEGGIWRYHPERKSVEVLTAGTCNPWGHDWNDSGEMFFINTVNGHFWHMMPGAHYKRPFTLDPNRRTYQLIDFHADHWHFDTSGSWTDSRDGAANAFGGGHAHCGTMIYQGGVWPSRYEGKLFTLNFHGRRANVESLHAKGSGFEASHAPDFFVAGDPWFRGMELSYGPDGNVIVLDWSDTGECHEHTGVHRQSGRIYKISYESKTPSLESVRLHDMDDQALAELHQHDNEWFCRQARLVLQERFRNGVKPSPSVVDSLVQLALSDQPRNAIRAISTLNALNQAALVLDRTEVLHSKSPAVRAHAISMLVDLLPLDDVFGPTQSMRNLQEVQSTVDRIMPTLLQFAQEDPSPRVRLKLASALQRLPVENRSALATALASHGGDEEDHNLPLMIWYALIPVADLDPQALVQVAMGSKLSTVRTHIARRLTEDLPDQAGPIDKLLDLASRTGDRSLHLDLLTGMTQALNGVRRTAAPQHWQAFSVSASKHLLEEYVRDLNVVFGDGRALDQIRSIALDAKADPDVRLSAVETLIQSRPEDLFQVCRQLLSDPKTNVIAAKGLATFDDPEVAEMILEKYRRFRAPRRGEILSLLVSRSSFAQELLNQIRDGRVPREDLTAFQARQIHSLGDEDLKKQLGEVWGEIHTTPEAKRRQIRLLKQAFLETDLEKADMANGRVLFGKHCGTCHRMYGEGGKVGPDLTGANRSNLDYLLENVVDPSAVVDKNYRMTVILLEDGRVINGLVLDKNKQSWTVQTATEKTVFAAEDVEEFKVTDKSPMPDGLLDSLTDSQRRDLMAYLQHPTQVPLPSTTPVNSSPPAN